MHFDTTAARKQLRKSHTSKHMFEHSFLGWSNTWCYGTSLITWSSHIIHRSCSLWSPGWSYFTSHRCCCFFHYSAVITHRISTYVIAFWRTVHNTDPMLLRMGSMCLSYVSERTLQIYRWLHNHVVASPHKETRVQMKHYQQFPRHRSVWFLQCVRG